MLENKEAAYSTNLVKTSLEKVLPIVAKYYPELEEVEVQVQEEERLGDNSSAQTVSCPTGTTQIVKRGGWHIFSRNKDSI